MKLLDRIEPHGTNFIAENERHGKARSLFWPWATGNVSLLALSYLIFIGWGFVTNSLVSWLSWQGYFMGLIGGKTGAWGGANVGIIFALVIGFVGHVLLSRSSIKRQEAQHG